MSTLTLPVEQARFNTAVPQGREPRNQYDVQTTARLSTFNMPQAVKVTVRPDDVCIFDFLYPVDERPRRKLMNLGAGSKVRVKLGHTSRKILAIVLSDASETLSRGPLDIPLATSAHDWAASLPGHARFACVRNAEVVSQILRQMPDFLRAKIADDVGHSAFESTRDG